MILTKRSLTLPASPPSVRLARSWVSRVLSEIGRDDLVDAARLGVSELVTNALIHSRPPLSVSVRGTIEHPRIEVVDSSPVPPQRAPVAPEIADVDGANVTTFGRGLDLVAMMSNRWGSDLAHDGRSKAVWFEPAVEVGSVAEVPGEIFSYDADGADGGEPLEVERYALCLLRLPPRLFGELRRYFFEIRRELRLLALAAPGEYPLAEQITEAFNTSDSERRATIGIEALDRAIARGELQVDLEYAVPTSAPVTMVRIRDLLAEVYRVFSHDELLAVRPAEVLVELQRWYFTEFERQSRGEEPLPWSGPLTMPAG